MAHSNSADGTADVLGTYLEAIWKGHSQNLLPELTFQNTFISNQMKQTAILQLLLTANIYGVLTICQV